MSAYVIVEAQISDPSQYDKYRLLTPGAIEAAGGRFVVRGGRCETLEGDWNPSRVVVVMFDTYDQAKAFYDSPLYVEARAARAGATRIFNMIVVEGVQ